MCPGFCRSFPCYLMSHLVPVTEEDSCRLLGEALVIPKGAFQVGVDQ